MHQPHPHSPQAHAAAAARRRRRRIRRRAGAALAILLLLGGGAALGYHTANRPGTAGSALASSTAQPPAAASGSTLAAGSTPAAASAAQNALGLTAQQAAAMLADPLMVLVNHTNCMPEDYTFDTAKCGSPNAINGLLHSEACEAFLAMQQAAAEEGVTIWMQSGYRSAEYQAGLYERKTKQYLDQGYEEAIARELAAGIVNPPGYSEHNTGLAADLNCPEYTGLDEGFEDTAAFAWLCQHAEQYGFILRYPSDAEEYTEITYEPWHWRYVGPQNAALINASGLCLEQYIAALQAIAGQG